MHQPLVLRDEAVIRGLPGLQAHGVAKYDVHINGAACDLRNDVNGVGADLVVETWISHSPRANDTTFDPKPGDRLLIGDDEEPPVRSRVVRRDGNRVWVQNGLSHLFVGVSSTAAEE